MLKVLKGNSNAGGTESLRVCEAQSMCSLFTADIDILEKMTVRRIMMAREKMPPVKVLKSGSSRYRINSVVEKKSAWFTIDLSTLKIFMGI
jgi:hypothetical protein